MVLRHIRCRRIAVVVAVLALYATFSYAASDKYTIRFNRRLFEQSSMSTRARGLGHSYAALSNGAAGVLENPAGLGAMVTRETLMEMGFDTVDEGGDEAAVFEFHAGGAINLNAASPHFWPRDNLGNHTVGAFLRYNSLEAERNDDEEATFTGIVLAYGRSYRGGRHFGGISLSYNEGGHENDGLTIDEVNQRWEFKVGGITRPYDHLALGATFSYGRGSISDESFITHNNGEVRSWELRVGGAYQLTDETLLVADITRQSLDVDFSTDTIYHEHKLWKLSGGLERVVIPSKLTLRGGLYLTHNNYDGKGLNTDSQIDDYFGITGGGSYFIDKVELGWTLDLRTTGEVGNYFKVGLEW